MFAAMSSTVASASQLPLGDLIAYHARRNPDAALLTIGDRVVGRAEFDLRCNKRARLLQRLGVQQGHIVTVALPKCLEFYETMFAIWKLGATPNPVSASLSDLELTSLLNVGQPRLVVGVNGARADCFATLAPCPELPDDLSAEPLASVVPAYWKAMTSGGSTGRPKLIVDHMAGAWDPDEGGLGQQPGETVLNAGPVYHNGPFLAVMYALFAGGHVVEMTKFDPAGVLEAIARYRVTWLFLVPTMMLRILRLPESQRAAHDLSSLRMVVHSASPCPAWLKHDWIEWLGPERILEIYTGTERQASATITGSESLSHPGSVGRIQKGAAIRILGENGEDVPSGEVGEIYLRPDAGRGTTYHYLGAEPRARGEWESLGDLGRLDADGYLYLSDRRADLIIRGGVNIYPAEVEAALESHPAVASAAVIGMPDDDLGEVVHAIVHLTQTRVATETMLREFVTGLLSHYKVPKTIEFSGEPLRDEAGKVRRSALRANRIEAREQAARP